MNEKKLKIKSTSAPLGPSSRKNRHNDNHKIIFGVTLLIIGLCFVVVRGGGHGKSSLKKGSGDEKFSILHSLFGKTIPVPGKQPDGSFVFSNFEKESDLKAWSVKSAKIQTTSNYPSEGVQSARVTFLGGGEDAALILEDYFATRGVPDWPDYGALRFHLYNPGKEDERLSFQIKDKQGNRYKQELRVPAEKNEAFTIPIDKIAAAINISKIDQLAIFRWEPQGNREFYLDDVRLVLRGFIDNVPAPMPSEPSAPATRDRPVQMLDYGFNARKLAWNVQDPDQGTNFIRIPVIVKNETPVPCKGCAAQGGVPFPMGELRSVEHIRLRNAGGTDIPFQSQILARWPDESLKWLAVYFMTSLRPMEGAGYYLEYGEKVEPVKSKAGVLVSEDLTSIRINTGPLETVLSKKSFYLFQTISFDRNQNHVIDPGEEVLTNASLTLTFHGEEYQTDRDRKTYAAAIEDKGDQRVVVKATGWFQSASGKRYCQAIVRYYFFAGKSSVQIAHTLIYTGYPENNLYEKYKELALPENETIGSFGIKLPYKFAEDGSDSLRIGQVRAATQVIPAKVSIQFLQKDWEHTLVEKEGLPVLSVPDNLSGWIDVANASTGITVAIRNFRENFPKAFAMDPDKGEIRIDLWPKDAGELDLATTKNTLGPDDKARGNAFGVAKTHEILFDFHPGNAVDNHAGEVATAFMRPLVIRTNPFWIDASGALGRLLPPNARYGREEKIIEHLFDWAARQPRAFQWYGMFNFGDTLTWWRDHDDEQDYVKPGWHPVGRWGWYNCEGVGTHTGAFLQFARTGNWKYFEFAENLARHIMDVDTVHYNTVANDARLRGVLNQEVSRVGSMHRHSGDHWGGRNEEASHTSVVGLLLYHYLSADERAEDVAKEIGEFFLHEPFTYTDHPDIAPHRAMANALWGDVLLFEHTGDVRYKNAADKIINIYLKGQQSDGSFLENYNPVDETWSGTKHADYMTAYALGAIMSYHELTQDTAVKEMLVKLVKYLNGSGSGAASIHGTAYMYFITGDAAFLPMVEKGLNEIIENQQTSSDPMIDGLIYTKPIYHRPNTFLYTMPYAFEALEAAQASHS